jgi:hypothetical protein
MASSARRRTEGLRLTKTAATFWPVSRSGWASGAFQVDWKVVVAQAKEKSAAAAARVSSRVLFFTEVLLAKVTREHFQCHSKRRERMKE